MKEIGKILTNELNKLKSLLASLLFIGILLPNETGDIVITEFFFKSGGDLPDYIEIYNATDSHLDLNGWVLEVDEVGLLASGHKIRQAITIQIANGHILDRCDLCASCDRHTGPDIRVSCAESDT